MHTETLYHDTARVEKRKIAVPHQETDLVMPDMRTVEVFTAGCPLCDDVVGRVRELACDSCDVRVVSLQDDAGAKRAEEVGVESVPAVAVNGTLATCCQDGGVQESDLRAAGIGDPR
jgi:glutaredoxin 3